MQLISLEKTFIEACNKHEHLKLLESQWRFDKELISKALQNISSSFPHYSRHDSSHSRQIIINIERILGERVQHLTATDMWLLLEAAYCHDIGMVVTYKQIQDMDTPDFKNFIDDIANDTANDLHEFAREWINGRATLPDGAAAHSFFDEYRQLLAEWYRKKHPENASKIINSPFEQIGLSSPRTELLPQRLFRALASVCNAHGQPFDKVMELPFSEAGMATEDCHPRYIASLLRMGDLLDIDDNRFCPVMMRMSGIKLPSHSHAHLEKHQGIRHFRLDSERIKIEVTCPSPDSYEIAHDWFKWLEREYHNQSQHWPKIVPCKKLGRLPTLTPPVVTLKAPYLIINEGKRPSFDLSRDAVLKILRTTGLYSTKEESIREILQNAVDSTIIAIWEKHKDLITKLTPSSEELYKIYDESMISIDFAQKDQEPNTFTLTVKDFGMGISKADLEQMLQVGKSNRNGKKYRLIRKMPDWFKPSGNFGIGLQSIYLLSDKFTITTKSRYSHEAFHLTFNSGKGSSVIIEKLSSESIDYGATVSVDIKINEFPEKISIPVGRARSAFSKLVNDYDFTRPDSNLNIYEQAKILEAIEVFNNGSPIKIMASQRAIDKTRDKVYFSNSTNIALSNIRFTQSDFHSLNTLFRGQPFSDLTPNIPLVGGNVDFYGYQAINFLTYNREKILSQAKEQAAQDIKQTLIEYIDNCFSEILEEDKPYAAALYYLSSEHNKEKYYPELMKLEVPIKNRGSMTLHEIIEDIKSGTIKKLQISDQRGHIQPATDIETPADLILISGGAPSTSLKLIKLLGTKANLYWQEHKADDSHSHICEWSKYDIQPVSDSILKKLMVGQGHLLEIGNRILFPGWGEYRKLAISANIPWARAHYHLSSNPDYFVLPYTFDPEGNRSEDLSEDLVNWVYKNKKDEKITLKEIASLHKQLITEIENTINKD